MSVKITSFEAENVKRVKAVQLEPKEDGLTVIGGRNNQGKTSVLDAIAWALAGNKRRPSAAKRDGAAGDPKMRVELSNGIVVERKGEGGKLKVSDPAGGKSGQALLDGFVGQLALDLPRFMEMNDSQKAEELLKIIGVGDELARLDAQVEADYNRRTTVGQMAKQKRGAADDMESYPDAPAEPVSAAELIEQQQGILARNGENQRKRELAREIERRWKDAQGRAANLRANIEDLTRRLNETEREESDLYEDLQIAAKTAEQLRDESTAEIEASIAAIDETNAKVRANAAKALAEQEAAELEAHYDELTARIEQTRTARRKLLEGADMPLPGLSVDASRLTYDGKFWDSMSGSEQLKVATAIVRKLKPDCGFVLVDKLEQMDAQTLAEFGTWAEGEGLQVIGTRVSTGDECSIVIEDGFGMSSAKAAEEIAVSESLTDCADDNGCSECSIPNNGVCERALDSGAEAPKWVM